jgi:hypothetical protein
LYKRALPKATAILDSLGAAGFMVLGPEVTPKMIAAAWNIFNRYPRNQLTPGPGFKEALFAMASAGDLTIPEV